MKPQNMKPQKLFYILTRFTDRNKFIFVLRMTRINRIK